MDFHTRLLLGLAAVAVIGYVALIYGGCALDPQCHVHYCGNGSYGHGLRICGLVCEGETVPRMP